MLSYPSAFLALLHLHWTEIAAPLGLRFKGKDCVHVVCVTPAESDLL